jgi:23S rRNA (cytidine1920-2'-O)/16S rRNA (cytidine1409-2'-O)-methyltransferase
VRADLFLVEQGYAKSRSEAQAAIKAGLVKADGALLVKPSQHIAAEAAVEYRKPHPFVSRAGGKLAAALDRFGLSPQRRVCLDLGSSTGGFTQVLLERGAAKIYAVDVGRGQMDAGLAKDPRVALREGVNARDLSGSDIPEPFTVLAADLSFISLKLALPPALSLAAPGAWAVVLVKPQFEVGRAAIGKGGIVRDQTMRERALKGIADLIALTPRWRVLGSMESPLRGGDGNIEFLLAATKA